MFITKDRKYKIKKFFKFNLKYLQAVKRQYEIISKKKFLNFFFKKPAPLEFFSFLLKNIIQIIP